MAQAAESSSQEYWRPPNPEVMRLVVPSPPGATCWHCGTQNSPGALFCQACGSARETRRVAPAPVISSDPAEFGSLHRPLGLSVPCLIFFVLGITCMIGAALTGMIYKTETLVDWQAVQIWRIEWLLGAAVALLAGILLKRRA